MYCLPSPDARSKNTVSYGRKLFCDLDLMDLDVYGVNGDRKLRRRCFVFWFKLHLKRVSIVCKILCPHA